MRQGSQQPGRGSRERAPWDDLRLWSGSDPKKWGGSQARSRYALAGRAAGRRELAGLARHARLVLLYSARDELHNQAVVVKEGLEEGIAH